MFLYAEYDIMQFLLKTPLISWEIKKKLSSHILECLNQFSKQNVGNMQIIVTGHLSFDYIGSFEVKK